MGKLSALDVDFAFNRFNVCVVRSHMCLTYSVMSFLPLGCPGETVEKQVVSNVVVGSPPKSKVHIILPDAPPGLTE